MLQANLSLALKGLLLAGAFALLCPWRQTSWSAEEAGQVSGRPGGLPPRAPVRVRGSVVDADTKQPVACRLYLQGNDGRWHFPGSADATGSAVAYRKERKGAVPPSVEMHTTLSAHPFEIDLPPGTYTIIVERGKEYFPLTRQIVVGDRPLEVQLPLQRWFDAAKLGWYSGDTHVHRTLEELPNIMLAEDLNVAFPLISWVHEAFAAPKDDPKAPFSKIDARPIPVDATHVIWPRNTEYEFFRVKQQERVLGAFLLLNQKTQLDLGAPPVRTIAERVHKEGGLIDLDKHNWPWSMALVPLMKPDLFELSNNHVWRTEFGFRDWGEPAAATMNLEMDRNRWTERGWIEYGFQNYYTLLNCGFRLMPSAGTASGVHPVPLGFGRVYAHLDKKFDYERWVESLRQGHTFVTTGPMLLAKVNDQLPGSRLPARDGSPRPYHITGFAEAPHPIGALEVIVNGEVARRIVPAARKTERGSYRYAIDETIPLDTSSWIAVRCFEDRPDGRVRFAHTAPFHVDVADRPLRPRKAEVEYLIQRVEGEIKRSAMVLPKEALQEYEEALKAYQDLARTAR